jgi:hypothetical protein
MGGMKMEAGPGERMIYKDPGWAVPMEGMMQKKMLWVAGVVSRGESPGYPRSAATRMCGSGTGQTRNHRTRCGNAGVGLAW